MTTTQVPVNTLQFSRLFTELREAFPNAEVIDVRDRRLRTPSCRGTIARHRWEPLPEAAADSPTHQCAWCGLVCRLGPQKRMLWYVDKVTGEHRSPFERTKEKTP